MPKRLDTPKICHACLLHFNGEMLKDIAILLDVAPNTLTRWRNTQIWQDYEAKLIEEWHQAQQEDTNTSSEPITMKLYENLDVVNELQRLLKEDYPYLEYGEHEASVSQWFSKQISGPLGDVLYVRVTDVNADRHLNVIEEICQKLSQATEIPFLFEVHPIGHFYKGGDQSLPPQNLQTQWTAFSLKKR